MAGTRPIPVEILQDIFENLLVIKYVRPYEASHHPLFTPTPGSLLDLRAVSLTCRLFHDIIEPILWRHINIGVKQRWQPVLQPTGPAAPQITTLLRLLHSRPDIAAHVHTIAMFWPDLHKETQSLSDDDVGFLSGLARELGLLGSDHIVWRNRPEGIDIIAGLAILLAPKVRLLDLFTDTATFFMVVPRLQGTTLRLEALQRLRLRPNSYKFCMAEVARLLRLAPNVKAFDYWPASRDAPRYPPAGDSGCIDWSGITSISLKNSALKCHTLVRLIGDFRGLEEFDLLPADVMDPDAILDALAAHASTLRKLAIDFGNDDDLLGGIGSLTRFIRLEYLTLTSWDIGVEEDCALRMLPPNLIRLQLTQCIRNDWQQEEIEEFAKLVKAGSYSKLREVQLEGAECDGDHDLGLCRPAGFSEESDASCDYGEGAMGELRALLEDAGVTCTIEDDEDV